MMDIKDRLSKADDRIKVMWKKYPVVMAILLLAGAVVGVAIGVILL